MTKYSINNRQSMVITIVACTLLLFTIIGLSIGLSNDNMALNFQEQQKSPSLIHLFGTDWLGRDTFTRTMKGLLLSIQNGFVASLISVVIAVIIGISGVIFGKKVDAVISWLIDMCLGMPHIVLMILVSFAVGGGSKGVIIAIAVTHWPALTRVVRAEILQLTQSHFIHNSLQMGKSKVHVGLKHIFPHLIPQITVGFVLLFPHAILHEASLTFLGFGLSPLEPSIGLVLSEGTKYIPMGLWWLIVFPGLSLLTIVLCFNAIGNRLNKLIDPYTSQG